MRGWNQIKIKGVCWGLAGNEFGRGGGLAFNLASVQAIQPGFDQRTVSVGKNE